MAQTVIFNHGKESGPWGFKIRRLAAIAEEMGHAVESLDYQHTMDPDERARQLLTECPARDEELILVGSSMGAYVAIAASQALNPTGLFLLAPAVYMPGYENQTPAPKAGYCTAVHAWADEIVPADNALRFCRTHGIDLHLVGGDHALNSVIDDIEPLFRHFLQRCRNSA